MRNPFEDEAVTPTKREATETVNGHITNDHARSVPLLGPVRRSPRGDWRTEVVLDCAHVNIRSATFAYCKDCTASKGHDGLWRRIITV
jgi:hypothetical protein